MKGHLLKSGNRGVAPELFENILEKTGDLSPSQRKILINQILDHQLNTGIRSKPGFNLNLNFLNDEQLAQLLEAIAELLRERQSQ